MKQAGRNMRASDLKERKSFQQFMKTNRVGDLAKWLAVISPETQVKKLELITKQHNKISVEVETERIRSNLRKRKL
jgi:hypothetical protein